MTLVTGGVGFIGSNASVALAQAGMPFIGLDNFCNSRRSVLERLERIMRHPISWVEGDVSDAVLLEPLFAQHPIDAVCISRGSNQWASRGVCFCATTTTMCPAW